MPINNAVWYGPPNTQEYIRQLEAELEAIKAAIRASGGRI